MIPCTGAFCDVRGCLGEGSSCSGHGYCDLAKQTCSCDTNWKGDGCNIWDCPGDPDCSGEG
ncbi:hypothetical protein DPMN_003914 [Dreissena polymorpha]|uniref:EGF-like domain-containing protein n=1 Tax=Dreissena polymorpha TaxID=45954 RepID=A0A9D4MRM6_DREPO|nr:hypothetical protein DPMN_003914 [Dreissena polymorpha]